MLLKDSPKHSKGENRRWRDAEGSTAVSARATQGLGMRSCV